MCDIYKKKELVLNGNVSFEIKVEKSKISDNYNVPWNNKLY